MILYTLCDLLGAFNFFPLCIIHIIHKTDELNQNGKLSFRHEERKRGNKGENFSPEEKPHNFIEAIKPLGFFNLGKLLLQIEEKDVKERRRIYIKRMGNRLGKSQRDIDDV